MGQYREVVNVVALGRDRLSTAVPPVIMSLCRGLSESGNNRRRFGPFDAESDEGYAFTPRTFDDLVDALVQPSSVTILTGHGGWEHLDQGWQLGASRSQPLTPLADLVAAVKHIPTKLLVVDACRAGAAAPIWRKVLDEEAVLLAADKNVGLAVGVRWFTTLFGSFAAYPGVDPLTRADYVAAIETTKACLLTQNGNTGRAATAVGSAYSRY